MSQISLDSTIGRSPDQVSTELEGETVVLSLASDEYYSLQNVGAHIWGLIQEPKTVRDVLDALLQTYAVERERCEHDLLAVLQGMAENGLVEEV